MVHLKVEQSKTKGQKTDMTLGENVKKGTDKHLEDYEPGATEEQVLAALRKAIRTPKTPSESPAPTSSKT